MDPSTLTLTPEEMRALGYRAVDLLVEHHAGARDHPPTGFASRETVKALLEEDIPRASTDPLQVLDRMRREVFRHMTHVDHPRFFAFVPGPSNFVGAVADALAAGFNIFAGTWIESAGPSQVELTTLRWMAEEFGLPEGSGGLFVSGGSVANLTALAAARHTLLGAPGGTGVIYASDQTHSSVARGARLLGLPEDHYVTLRSDTHFRMDMEALSRRIREDREEGRRPFAVVANAGTTNTGAVDPLTELAVLCREEGLWLHADAAYGGGAVLCPEGRAALKGIDEVDSLALDPHKWLFQPFECGLVLLRQGELLRDTFHILPEYMKDTQGDEGEVNFCDRGIQLTRSARALKLWMSLQVFGRDGFEAAVARGFHLARVAEAEIRKREEWEVVTPAGMGVVTARCAPPGFSTREVDRFNRALVPALLEEGYAMVVSTELRGRPVLRLCPINPRTTQEDIRETVAWMDRVQRRLRGVTR